MVAYAKRPLAYSATTLAAIHWDRIPAPSHVKLDEMRAAFAKNAGPAAASPEAIRELLSESGVTGAKAIVIVEQLRGRISVDIERQDDSTDYLRVSVQYETATGAPWLADKITDNLLDQVRAGKFLSALGKIAEVGQQQREREDRLSELWGSDREDARSETRRLRDEQELQKWRDLYGFFQAMVPVGEILQPATAVPTQPAYLYSAIALTILAAAAGLLGGGLVAFLATRERFRRLLSLWRSMTAPPPVPMRQRAVTAVTPPSPPVPGNTPRLRPPPPPIPPKIPTSAPPTSLPQDSGGHTPPSTMDELESVRSVEGD
jgi:hypothetical protein